MAQRRKSLCDKISSSLVQRFRFKRPRFRLRRNSKGFPRKLSRRTFVCKWRRFVHFCSTQKRNECTDAMAFVAGDNFSASLSKRICFSRFSKSSRKGNICSIRSIRNFVSLLKCKIIFLQHWTFCQRREFKSSLLSFQVSWRSALLQSFNVKQKNLL